MIKKLLFDNDGTLYRMAEKFEEIVSESMIDFLSIHLSMPKDKVVEERKRLIEKYNVKATEFVFKKEYGVNIDDFIKQTYFSISFDKCNIRPDPKLRKILREINLPMSLLTNNPSEFARRVIGELGIEDLFEHIIGSRELNYDLKPNKGAFLQAINITGYVPEETMFVDDRPENLKTAKKLGMETILIGNIKQENEFRGYKTPDIYGIKDILEKRK